MTTELDIARPTAGLSTTPATNMAAHLQDHLAALRAADQIAALIHKTVRAYDGGYDDKGKQRPGQKEAAVAIYHGQLIGLDPIQSLQNIFVVHGTPSMYARTMKALLLRAGHQVETVETGDHRAIVRAKHRAAAEWEESTWTIERAQKAGYMSNSKYRTDPEGMLYARALADACRRAAPDVLLGMAYSAEELETDPVPVRATSERIQVAEVLDAEEPAEAPKVQQWQAPAEDKGGSTDAISQPAAENPESNSAAPEPPTPAGATGEQIKALGAVLKAEGRRTRKQQLDYLTEQFGRQIADPVELTEEECVSLTEFLVKAQEVDQAADPQQTLDADQ